MSKRSVGQLNIAGALLGGALLFSGCAPVKTEFRLAGKFRGFTCSNPDSREPVPDALRRLSRTQYINTLRDLLGAFMDSNHTSQVMNGLSSLLLGVPEEVGSREEMKGLQQSVSSVHVDAYYRIAQRVASDIAGNATRLAAVAGSCATSASTNNATCQANFIRNFGLRAFRRPLRAEDITHFQNVYSRSGSSGYADVLSAMLQAPSFLYLMRFEGPLASGRSDLYSLDAYELASRISYLFWQSMPDSGLLAAAASGSLLTEAGYRGEVDRVFADAKTRRGIQEFFTRWLRLDEQLALSNPSAYFNAVLGEQPAVVDPSALRADMATETLEFAEYQVRNQGTYASLLESTVAFPRSQVLADVYGTPVWSGTGTPPSFPAGQRSGLLGRINLVNGAAQRPIIRGAHIYTDILCQNLTPPANTDPPPGAVVYLGQTVRQKASAITQIPGTACASCHTATLNPLGFALGNFDGLGRYRTQERVYVTEGASAGNLHSIQTIDASVTLPSSIVPQTQKSASSQIELSKAILAGGYGNACLTRQYFRFAMQRLENLSSDGCALNDLQGASGTLEKMMKAAAYLPEFKVRKKR